MNENPKTAEPTMITEVDVERRATEIREEMKKTVDEMVASAVPEEHADDPFLRMSLNVTLLNSMVSTIMAGVELKMVADIENLVKAAH